MFVCKNEISRASIFVLNSWSQLSSVREKVCLLTSCVDLMRVLEVRKHSVTYNKSGSFADHLLRIREHFYSTVKISRSTSVCTGPTTGANREFYKKW